MDDFHSRLPDSDATRFPLPPLQPPQLDDHLANTLRQTIQSQLFHNSDRNCTYLADLLVSLHTATVGDAYLLALVLFKYGDYQQSIATLQQYNLAFDFSMISITIPVFLQAFTTSMCNFETANMLPPINSAPGSLNAYLASNTVISMARDSEEISLFLTPFDMLRCSLLYCRCLYELKQIPTILHVIGPGTVLHDLVAPHHMLYSLVDELSVPEINDILHLGRRSNAIAPFVEIEQISLAFWHRFFAQWTDCHLHEYSFLSPILAAGCTAPSIAPRELYGPDSSVASGGMSISATWRSMISQLAYYRAKTATLLQSNTKISCYYISKAFLFDCTHLESLKTLIDCEFVTQPTLDLFLVQVFSQFDHRFTNIFPFDINPPGNVPPITLPNAFCQRFIQYNGHILKRMVPGNVNSSIITDYSLDETDVGYTADLQLVLETLTADRANAASFKSTDTTPRIFRLSFGIVPQPSKISTDWLETIASIMVRSKSHLDFDTIYSNLHQMIESSQKLRAQLISRQKKALSQPQPQPQPAAALGLPVQGILAQMHRFEASDALTNSQGLSNSPLILTCLADSLFRQHRYKECFQLTKTAIYGSAATFPVRPSALIVDLALAQTSAFDPAVRWQSELYRPLINNFYTVLSQNNHPIPSIPYFAPHCGEIFVNTCWELGKIDELSNFCTLMTKTHPNSATLWYSMCVYYLATSQYRLLHDILEKSPILSLNHGVLTTFISNQARTQLLYIWYYHAYQQFDAAIAIAHSLGTSATTARPLLPANPADPPPSLHPAAPHLSFPLMSFHTLYIVRQLLFSHYRTEFADSKTPTIRPGNNKTTINQMHQKVVALVGSLFSLCFCQCSADSTQAENRGSGDAIVSGFISLLTGNHTSLSNLAASLPSGTLDTRFEFSPLTALVSAIKHYGMASAGKNGDSPLVSLCFCNHILLTAFPLMFSNDDKLVQTAALSELLETALVPDSASNTTSQESANVVQPFKLSHRAFSVASTLDLSFYYLLGLSYYSVENYHVALFYFTSALSAFRLNRPLSIAADNQDSGAFRTNPSHSSTLSVTLPKSYFSPVHSNAHHGGVFTFTYQVLHDCPEFTLTLLNLGHCYFKMHMFVESIVFFTLALTISHSQSVTLDAQLGLGMCYHLLADLARAKEMYSVVLASDSSHRMCLTLFQMLSYSITTAKQPVELHDVDLKAKSCDSECIPY